MKHIPAAALICIFLLGCATTGIHDGGRIEQHEISVVPGMAPIPGPEPLPGPPSTAQEPDVIAALPGLPEPVPGTAPGAAPGPEPRLPDVPEAAPETAAITPREAPVIEAGRRFVYLTFDDGPSPNTGRILDILSRNNIKGTFFLVGDHILDNEFMEYEDSVAAVRRVHAEGHYIGLHSMTHLMRHLYQVPGAHSNFYDEMRELQNLISEITGGFTSSLYRAPYGTRGMFTRDHIRTMAASDLRAWDWDVDPEDWKLRTVDAILEKIESDMNGRRYPDRVVILLHERNISVQALPSVIEYFRNLNYTFLPYSPASHFPMNLLYNPDL